jgi:hypothetical protein
MSIFLEKQKKYIAAGKDKLIENIKILLYKENPNIFDIIDFENDNIYLEPLLFSYFANKTYTNLNTIIYGYTDPKLRPDSLEVKSDEFGRIYLPNLGWIITTVKNDNFQIEKQKNSFFKLIHKNKELHFKLEPIQLINETKIELLKYPVPILNQYYYDVHLNSINVEVEEITNSNLGNLIKSFSIIKQLIPKHYELIQLVTQKIVVFNIDSVLKNSFATIQAQGIAFINAYQKDYNEVFFIDDIAHQTGHIIFTSMTTEVENFIKIDPSTPLQRITNSPGNINETRDVYVLFHAIYTYYTTLIYLDKCLDSGLFDKNKRHEALGRVNFYIKKAYKDIDFIEKIDFGNGYIGPENIFTNNGLEIYVEIKAKCNYISKKWWNIVKIFNTSNQPYNFTYSKFLKLNLLDEKRN